MPWGWECRGLVDALEEWGAEGQAGALEGQSTGRYPGGWGAEGLAGAWQAYLLDEDGPHTEGQVGPRAGLQETDGPWQEAGDGAGNDETGPHPVVGTQKRCGQKVRVQR